MVLRGASPGAYLWSQGQDREAENYLVLKDTNLQEPGVKGPRTL